jgi:GST-like protein
MIDLYTWPTPNGRKVSIMLEELGLSYRAITVDISNGEQFTPEYLRLSPNGKIPAIVDHEGPNGGELAVFESGAILIYLAEKAGSPLWPNDAVARLLTLEWLMFQMSGLGPMLGQAHYFRRFAEERVPYAIERYEKEAVRLYGVLDRRLGEAEYLAGDYSIADIASFPWIARHEWQGITLSDYANIARWFAAIAARPAVQRGMKIPKV